MELSLSGERRDKPFVVLAIAPHSDDIEIGCGGTLLSLREQYGSAMKLIYVLLTRTESREQEARAAAEVLRADRVLVYDYPDTKLPLHWAEIKDDLQKIRDEEAQIDLVFSPYRLDEHQDHKTVADNVWRTFRNHMILEYEIPKYEGDLQSPNVYVPITDETANKKMDLLIDCFPSRNVGAEKHHWFTRDTFLGLMRIRGVECISQYAEGFHGRKLVLGFAS